MSGILKDKFKYYIQNLVYEYFKPNLNVLSDALGIPEDEVLIDLKELHLYIDFNYTWLNQNLTQLIPIEVVKRFNCCFGLRKFIYDFYLEQSGDIPKYSVLSKNYGVKAEIVCSDLKKLGYLRLLKEKQKADKKLERIQKYSEYIQTKDENPSFKEIASNMGIYAGLVKKDLESIGYVDAENKIPLYLQERKKRMEFYKENVDAREVYTITELSKELGVSSSTIYNDLRQLDFEFILRKKNVQTMKEKELEAIKEREIVEYYKQSCINSEEIIDIKKVIEGLEISSEKLIKICKKYNLMTLGLLNREIAKRKKSLFYKDIWTDVEPKPTLTKLSKELKKGERNLRRELKDLGLYDESMYKRIYRTQEEKEQAYSLYLKYSHEGKMIVRTRELANKLGINMHVVIADLKRIGLKPLGKEKSLVERI